MRVCGIDIKGSEALLVIVTSEEDTATIVESQTKKVKLDDDEDSEQLKAFLSTMNGFFHENKIDKAVIRTRQKRGSMAGGGVSFKIEAIIQLANCEVEFVSPQALARFAKKNAAGIPSGLHNYQETAFRCAAFYLHQKSVI